MVLGCWYCGVHVDEWKDGDDVLAEHLLHSKATGHARDATCRYALYVKQLKKWKAGGRVRPRHVSSPKEIWRNFSDRPSRRSAEHSGSDGEGGEAASSSSGLPVRIPSKEVEEVVEDTPMEAAVGWDKESILKMYGVIASTPKRRCLRKEDSLVSVASSAVMEAVPPADHGSQAEPADAAVGVGGEALATSIIRIILTIGG